MPASKGSDKYKKRLVRKRAAAHSRKPLAAASYSGSGQEPLVSRLDSEWQILRTFAERRGISIDLYDPDRIHQRSGSRLEYHIGGWVGLVPKPGHHPVYNRKRLRMIAVDLCVPYWRDMTVRDMIALFLIIADSEGLPEVAEL